MNRALAYAIPIAARLRPVPDAAPLFLDIEASSLSPDSWPVEVGWAWVQDAAVESRSAIVAPRPSWCPSAWSESAFDLHGISFERVRGGHDADVVAAMTDAFADRFVVSDNPLWDQRWLDRLRDGRPRIAVHPLHSLSGTLEPDAANAFALALLRSPVPHRAGDDAARLARAWAAAAA